MPAYLSNGLIGLRAGPIPLVEGLAIVSGLTSTDPPTGVDAFARGPYPFAGDIAINSRQMSRLQSYRHFVEQRYDFSCGELTSRFTFTVDGVTAECEVVSFCSRSMPTLVLQRVTVTVDAACRLGMRCGIDTTGLLGRMLQRTLPPNGESGPPVDGSVLWETNGAGSLCGAAYSSHFHGGDGVERTREDKNPLAPLMTEYKVKARPGRKYVLDHIASLVPSAFHEQPDKQASRLVNVGAHRGFDRLRQENCAAWSEIWPARPILHGAPARWQQMADAAFYYLHASAHASSMFSTGMFGMAAWTNYHYYRGHVMWDIETFALPSILIAAPETARSMLHYRFARLSAAQRNAAMNGYSGLQFPWESSAALGQEVTPIEGSMFGLEQHVSLSVAMAFANFANATADEEFRKEQAWPVLRGVADWIVSRVVKTRRGYEFRDTLGIAEGRPAPVHNNAYVNMSAVVALQEAIAVARALDMPKPLWCDVANKLFIPIDRERGTIKNHDAFTVDEGGDVGATPEALAGFFPSGYRCAPELMQKTMGFYLGRIEPYIGSPMLSALLGVYASWMGDRKKSAELFEVGYAEFINEPFRETNEFSNVRMPDKPRGSPLFANIGGFLSSVYFGLPRLRMSPDGLDSWSEGEATLPEGWDGIEAERIWLRGRPYRLSCSHGETTTLELLE